MLNTTHLFHNLKIKYWPLFKSLQTMLLVMTGVAGYLSAYPIPVQIWPLLGLVGTLFLTISGSTVINMWFDRDLDARMQRTCHRPLVTGQVSPTEALLLGLLLVILGLGWSLALSPTYTIVALAGLFFEVVVYTLWLKRHTAWSIVLGGIAGGMPILGGRVVATGTVDAVGLLLALVVLLWIPAHNLSYNILRLDDYQRASVPTFPSVYGLEMTRRMIAFSSILVALAMTAVSIWIGLPSASLCLLMGLQIGLVGLTLTAWHRPSMRISTSVFQYASFYMLGCMFLLAANIL